MNNNLVPTYKNIIINYLKKRYDEKGVNFYFKAKDLKKVVPTSTSKIGQICTELFHQDILDIWNPATLNRTYRTKFNNGHRLTNFCTHCGDELSPSDMCINPKCPENGIIQVFKVDFKERFIEKLKMEREVCR